MKNGRTNIPTYTFRNKETLEEWEERLSFSEREEKLKDPNIEQIPGAPAIVSGTKTKPDSGFRDLLKTIRKNNIWSKIETF
jgi:hypothetical protein